MKLARFAGWRSIFEEVKVGYTVSCTRGFCQEGNESSKSEPLCIHRNATGIQMLAPGLHRHLYNIFEPVQPSLETEETIKSHLSGHGLWGKASLYSEAVDFSLPELCGSNIEEHFISIAKDQTKHYFGFAEAMSSCLQDLPAMPKLGMWKKQQGWAKYVNGEFVESVQAPDEKVMVFDVEVCVNAGNIPIIATAASKSAWQVFPILLCDEILFTCSS